MVRSKLLGVPLNLLVIIIVAFAAGIVTECLILTRVSLQDSGTVVQAIAAVVTIGVYLKIHSWQKKVEEEKKPKVRFWIDEDPNDRTKIFLTVINLGAEPLALRSLQAEGPGPTHGTVLYREGGQPTINSVFEPAKIVRLAISWSGPCPSEFLLKAQDFSNEWSMQKLTLIKYGPYELSEKHLVI